MRLGEIKPGLNLSGVEPMQIVSFVANVPVAEGALQLVCRLPHGSMKERLGLQTNLRLVLALLSDLFRLMETDMHFNWPAKPNALISLSSSIR